MVDNKDCLEVEKKRRELEKNISNVESEVIRYKKEGYIALTKITLESLDLAKKEIQELTKGTLLELNTPYKYRKFMKKDTLMKKRELMLFPVAIANVGVVSFIGNHYFTGIGLMIAIVAFMFNVYPELKINKPYWGLKELRNRWEAENELQTFIKNNSTLPELYTKWKKSQTGSEEELAIEQSWNTVLEEDWNTLLTHQKAISNAKNKIIEDTKKNIVGEMKETREKKNCDVLPVIKELNKSR